MFRWVCTFVIASVVGCGGSQAAVKRQGSDIRGAIAEIERKNHNKMRDLEHQIVMLEDRLRSAQQKRRPPPLPVEVRAPDLDDDEYEVVGSDEDGVEIVYVGDAARGRSVTIPGQSTYGQGYRGDADRGNSDLDRLSRHERSIRYGPSDRPGRKERREVRRRGRAADQSSDSMPRLPVTERVGPTVQEQIRKARGARQAQSAGRAAGDSVPRPGTGSVRDRRDGAAGTSSGPSSPHSARTAPGSRADSGGGQPARSRPVSRDPVTAYKASYEALREDNHDRAIVGFRDFLARHPGHEYADNALYWLGEAFYDQRDYRTALAEFRKVVTEYPRGNKVPDALLKMGYCYLALGDAARARSTLADVIERHPNSGPAKLAARRLDSLGN
ncbi:MAG: tol-pal system protein YbgF [Proteobacteria bacterium]|nr:tol-pal system protein YbgF [Pseudomonadota bacterium]